MQITCPKCQRQLRVADTAAGKLVRCPGCSGTFQAVDTVEEYVQAKPPQRPAAPPRVEEAPRPRRRLEEEDDDDRPRRRRDEDEDDRPRSRRRHYDDEDDEEFVQGYTTSRKEARRRGKSAGVWFIIAGIAILATVAINLIVNLSFSSNFGGPPGFGGAYLAGKIAGVIGCGAVAVLGAVFHFLAAARMKSLSGRGQVITAIVFGFVFGVIFGIISIFNIVALVALRVGGSLMVLIFLQMVLGATTSFFNLFAAIKGIVVLNNPAVSRAFRRG